MPRLVNKCDVLIGCEVCAKAKQTRLEFSISNTHSKEVFDVIHVDLWGSYHKKSLSRAHYILTIVDDFSRAT